MNWTNEQIQAIYEKGNNILVAAAARKREDSCFSRTHYKQNSKRKDRYKYNINSNLYKCSCF